MATLIRKLLDGYHYLNVEAADPRASKLFLVGSPIPVIIILVIYHRFVRKWGPAFMEHRQPFQIKNLMILYNILQIYLSAELTWTSFRVVYWSGYYSIKCQKMVTEDNAIEQLVVSKVWLYYMIKIIDLFDTVFFVLRKNFRQVTFLHLYHHMGMCLLGFMGTKYVPGGHGVMLGFINCFVHTIMYTYYLISIVRPGWVRRWWKKYITQLQILQFLLLTIHFGHVLFRSDCQYPKWVSFAFLPQNIFMLVLFTDFYIKEYVKKKKV